MSGGDAENNTRRVNAVLPATVRAIQDELTTIKGWVTYSGANSQTGSKCRVTDNGIIPHMLVHRTMT